MTYKLNLNYFTNGRIEMGLRKRKEARTHEEDEKKQLGILLDPALHHKIKVIAALKRESLSEAVERYLMEAVPTLEEALTSSAIVVSGYKKLA